MIKGRQYLFMKKSQFSPINVLHVTENTETIKPHEKVDDFLLSLFKALDRQKSKDDRKIVEKKVTIFPLIIVSCSFMIKDQTK